MSTPALPGTARAVLLLHRRSLLLFGAFVGSAAAGLVALRFAGAAAARTAGPCGSPGTGLPPCPPLQLPSSFDYSANLSSAASAIAWLPLVVAFHAGAVLFGAELERGTAALSWTQSVTPARWLAAKLAVPAALLTAGLAVLSLLYRWARGAGPGNLIADEWYYTDVFVALGPSVLAYGLLALAAGALAGLLLRRALPAGTLALGATGLVWLLFDGLRDRLWPTATVVWRESRGELGNSAWEMEHGLVLPSGERVRQCVTPQSASPPGCRPGTGIREWYAVHHPPSHFWPIQLVETGIVLALAAAATYAAFRVLRRRHA
ncbi:hypothetical protein ACIOWI_32825 [Streptomyces sp. NPDC087659]|uniref:hypothetical protein n=1 Tax=unclassified Streptomyces TaxID=2593676 RepID=UPI0036EA2EFE